MRIDKQGVNKIKQNVRKGFKKGIAAVLADVKKSGGIPRKSGELEQATRAEISGDSAIIISDTPYAARQYFDPRISHDRSINKNAGGHWFAPYVGGNRREVWVRGGFG
ncbi:MAG: hypothetical protein FWB71_01400 [Defluviitaleaceae bacterium]|nr:hypothetical protein [Defluviitaleaceae bacterium]